MVVAVVAVVEVVLVIITTNNTLVQFVFPVPINSNSAGLKVLLPTKECFHQGSQL
jgi:hypothetical protein